MGDVMEVYSNLIYDMISRYSLTINQINFVSLNPESSELQNLILTHN